MYSSVQGCVRSRLRYMKMSKLRENIFLIQTKGHSLYQISSKMLPGSKVITLVEKKRKEVAWLRLELTTSHLEIQCANHYTMETFMMNLYFFKCHNIKVITFEPGNIFELIWYSEWPLHAIWLYKDHPYKDQY